MLSKHLTGHLCALFTVFVWGTTFISSKILLEILTPVQILCLRFLLGWIALWLIPAKMNLKEIKAHLLLFVLAGICGVGLYYWAENLSLVYTMAGNVSVIVSTAPFFTALFAPYILKSQKGQSGWFYAGFVLAMAGIALISLGSLDMQFSWIGDGLALAAGLLWALYSLMSTRISELGMPVVATTRVIFFFGMILLFAALMMEGSAWPLEQMSRPEIWMNLLYLGLAASAGCFVTWSVALKNLGPVSTSVYIYAVPLITYLASWVVLGESISLAGIGGTVLILAGLFLSSRKSGREDMQENPKEILANEAAGSKS